MKHTLLFLGLFLTLWVLPAQETLSWEDIPNVQLQDSTQFVSDVAHIIEPNTLARINETLHSLRQTHGVEGVVITLPTIGQSGSIEDLARERVGANVPSPMPPMMPCVTQYLSLIHIFVILEIASQKAH